VLSRHVLDDGPPDDGPPDDRLLDQRLRGTSMITVLDPTFDEAPRQFVRATRAATMAGATVGLLSNGKVGTRTFFDHLEQMLRAEWKVAEVVRRTKSNYSAPAEAELIAEAAGWAVMFAGVGD
jgi:hypothetical protein